LHGQFASLNLQRNVATQGRRRKRDRDLGLGRFGGSGTAAAAAARSLLPEDTIHVDRPAATAQELAEKVCGLVGVHFLEAAGAGAPLEFRTAGTAGRISKTARPSRAGAIVLGPFILVAQHIVCFLHFLELGLRLFVKIGRASCRERVYGSLIG